MRHKYSFLGIIIIALVTAGLWHRAAAVARPTAVDMHPVQPQIQDVLSVLRESEAERVMGTYIPGTGVVFTLDLLRGPNVSSYKTAVEGTRDWLIYFMETFGAQLEALPETETVTFAAQFYDYETDLYHSLVLQTPQTAVHDSSAYMLWLDGYAYSTAALPPPTEPETSPRLSVPDIWEPIAGTWIEIDGGYAQADASGYDQIQYWPHPLNGTYSVAADLRYVSGSMGGGIVFNAPDLNSKNGASMVAYTADGTYLQWGYYDEEGAFQFQGGSAVPSPTPDQLHKLRVSVDIDQGMYQVDLDGEVLAQSIPLTTLYAENYVGMLTSTSHVEFNNFAVEGG